MYENVFFHGLSMYEKNCSFLHLEKGMTRSFFIVTVNVKIRRRKGLQAQMMIFTSHVIVTIMVLDWV